MVEISVLALPAPSVCVCGLCSSMATEILKL